MWFKKKNKINDMQLDIFVSKIIDLIVDKSIGVDVRDKMNTLITSMEDKVDFDEVNEMVIKELKRMDLVTDLRKKFIKLYFEKDTKSSDWKTDTPNVLRLANKYFVPNINSRLERIEKELRFEILVLEDKYGMQHFNDTPEECNEFDYLENLIKAGYKVCNIEDNVYFCRKN